MWTKSPGYVYGGEVGCVEGRRYVGVKIEVRGNLDIVEPLMWMHYWDVYRRTGFNCDCLMIENCEF